MDLGVTVLESLSAALKDCDTVLYQVMLQCRYPVLWQLSAERESIRHHCYVPIRTSDCLFVDGRAKSFIL